MITLLSIGGAPPAEAAKAVYYSVGTSIADLKAGAPTITISAGVATFSLAQPDNVGVGDRITYNGATIAYISGRRSSTQYTLTTATGAAPANVAGATVTSIRRAFNSLSTAEASSTNATHLNTADLVAANIQLNWPCYNDAVLSDQVQIRGYTTGPTHYLRVYTPTSSAEVGVSQRHRGVFGTGFQISQTDHDIVQIFDAYVRVEGLVIQATVTAAGWYGGIESFPTVGTNDIRISHNIVKGVVTVGNPAYGILVGTNATDVHRVWNNVVYNFPNTTAETGVGIGILNGIAHVFNNTVYNCQVGIIRHSTIAGSQVRNNVSINDALNTANTDYLYLDTAPAVPRSHNVSSDTTSETASLRSKTAYPTYFKNTTPGTEDFHLLNYSLSLWGSSGADLSADPKLAVTDDIDRGPRVRPDIGADEFGVCCDLSTTEVPGSTITVTGVGQFELRFNAATGGGIDQVYDLAEDPTKTYDLAGGVNDLRTLHDFEIAPFSGAFAGVHHTTDDDNAGARVDLLEATPTRVRVRQDAFFQQDGGTNILGGLKGIGDYSVYGVGRTAVRWTETDSNTPASVYATRRIGMTAHYTGGGPPSYTPCYEGNVACFVSGGGGGAADWLLGVRDVANARTDFLTILSQDWVQATTVEYYSNTAVGQEAYKQIWQQAGTGSAASQAWNLLTYFKPTNLGSTASPWLDDAVIWRSSDYQGPDSLSVTVGSPWIDASQNTAGGDDFNEAEAAYVLTLDPNPGQGLTFQIDGTVANPRYSPFFKIRQWRSVVAPTTITVEGVSKTRDVDYRADVKPVSRAHFAPGSAWHSTLESQTQVDTSPDIGHPGLVVGAPTFVPARYGTGVNITLASEYVGFDTSDFNKAIGAIEFWFQPAFGSTDGFQHDICGFVFDASNYFLLEKLDGAGGNDLRFRVRATGMGAEAEVHVPSTDYSWRANDWVHLRIEWDDTAPLATQQRLYLNGVEPAHTDPTVDYASTGLSLASQFWLGNADGDATFSPGIYDEVYVYGGSSATPASLAYGGLTTSSREYLADPGKNFALSFAGVDADRRGEYFYLGSDSPFRGLNIRLQTPGAGVVAGALEWEYWNGTAWESLETVGGFADTTFSFTRDGTVFWTADPALWAPYSVNGGPDLYYVRVHLVVGSTYTTAPVESLIKTDILLFQYCADITAAAQTFQFPAASTADLAIAKDDGQATAVPGNPVTYTITVTNNGPDTLTKLSVIDAVPAALLGPSFAPSAGTYDGGTSLWSGLNLAPTQSVTLLLSGTIDPFARGTLTNAATVAPPAGGTDPNGANDSASDTDSLIPSADLGLTKLDDLDPAGLGGVLTYTLAVTNAGLSGATGVTLTDALPVGVTFESATPTQGSCGYDGPTRTLTCALGSIGPSSSASVSLKVRPQAVGTVVNTASVLGNETDPAAGNNSAAQTTTVQISSIGVRFFTVTSTSQKNVLEWVNPTADYVSTEIAFRTDRYPTGSGDGTVLYDAGVPGGQEKLPHLTGAGSNGVTHYYAAFVHRSTPPVVSPGRFCAGRPFDDTGAVKWAFSTGAAAVSPPTVGGAGVVAPSNDRVLYAMERGPLAPGGEWPGTWWPIELGDVVQSRSPVVPIPVGTANPVVYLGSQDGSLYAVDATRGGKVGFPWGPTPIGPMVQAAPAGIFTGFNGAFDYLLVGTRDGLGPNAFVALDPFSGAEVGRFDNGGAGPGAIGIINGAAAVDYATQRVYFTSRTSTGGSATTLWCLQLVASPTVFTGCGWATPRALGDIDSSPVIRGGRIYVGSSAGGGTVYSIDAASGAPALDRTFVHGDGQVKGFVFPDRSSDDIYFATENFVWGVADLAGGMSNKFAAGISLGPGVKPSPVLFVPGSHYVYVGGSDGKLREIDVLGAPGLKALPLGNGLATVGAPSLDRVYNLVHVGAEDGVFYAVETPLP